MGSKASTVGLTLTAGLGLLTTFARKRDEDGYGSIDWSVLMETADGYAYHSRISQPCYGEMRPYARGYAGNGPYEPELLPVSQREVFKPSDLYAPFPEGKPVGVAVPFRILGKGIDWAMEKVLLNPEISPYRSILKDFEIERKKNGSIIGVVIKDTNIDPSVMVNFFRKASQTLNNVRIQTVNELFPNAHPLSAFVFAHAICEIDAAGNWQLNTDTEYSHYFGKPNTNWAAIMNGKPVDLTDGGTFAQRYAYNRPKNDFIWGEGKRLTKLAGIEGESGGKAEAQIIIDYLTSLIE